MKILKSILYAGLCMIGVSLFWLPAVHAQESDSDESVLPSLESSTTEYPPGTVGIVVAYKGEISALDASGASRPLEKADGIRVGETVRTGDGSYAVVEFVDGAKATVRPNSELRVDRYAYDTGDDGAVMSLVKGGLRAVTGSIARERPESYRVKTNVATLGVRGTEFSLRVCENDCSEEAERFSGSSQGLEGEGYRIIQ